MPTKSKDKRGYVQRFHYVSPSWLTVCPWVIWKLHTTDRTNILLWLTFSLSSWFYYSNYSLWIREENWNVSDNNLFRLCSSIRAIWLNIDVLILFLFFFVFFLSLIFCVFKLISSFPFSVFSTFHPDLLSNIWGM